MIKRILGAAAAVVLLGACEADRTAITQPSLRASASSVSEATDLCNRCAFGPRVFVRQTGSPVTETIHFSGASALFMVDIDNLATQGAAADVSLNGTSLVADGLPAHFNQLVTLKAENTLVVRLTGKPGSRLQIAIWLFKPVTLDAVTLEPGSVKLDGSPVPFNATITNHTGALVPNLRLEMYVAQDWIRGLWGGNWLNCGMDLGVLSISSCIMEGTFQQPAPSVGFAPLVPGDALAVILVRRGSEVLDSLTIPIILPTPAPAVLHVFIDPPRVMLLPNQQTQVTASVQSIGGAAKTVTWSVTGLPVVTVNPSGVVTAVGMGLAPGPSWIRATSTADPTKWAEIPVAVYDFRMIAPDTPVEIATSASLSHPTSVELKAGVCGDIGLLAENPFTSVDFAVWTGFGSRTLGTGAVSHTETVGPGGMHSSCWFWSFTWTPGTSVGFGQQMVFATAFGGPLTPPLTTSPNTKITIVFP